VVLRGYTVLSGDALSAEKIIASRLGAFAGVVSLD